MMAPYADYRPEITETHHTMKKDAPSGTAISLAQQIVENNPAFTGWALAPENTVGQIPIIAHRIDPVPGTHTVAYKSAIDDIEITNTAHSRDGFALGAVLAAEFVYGKSGVFTMADVLGLNQQH